MSTDNILAPIASLALPDSTALTGRAQQALTFIESFQVDSAEAFALAAEELQAIKARSNRLEEQRTAITKPLNQVLKAVNDLFRGPAALLERGELILKTKMLGYQQEQQRIAAEAQRLADERAAAQRRQLEEEAAARQREAQAQAAAAAAAKAAGDEQAARLAQAAAQRAQAEAQATATTAQLVVAAPIAAIAAPKAKGISTSTKVDFEVVNLHELVKHVAAHPELISLLVADSVRLRAYVKGLGTACQLPGVRVFEASVMAARAAA
jgi:chemotaxis protein histidine kinase CheA